mgnify:CR=1 FL=1
MYESFAKENIEVEITLAAGNSGEGDTKSIHGLACECTITKPGLPEKGRAELKIWGLPYADLAQLTTLAFEPMESEKNLISISAGEEGGEMSRVFAGEIASAWADFNSAPDVCLSASAESGFYPQRISAPPMSVNGEAPAADLISALAAEMGYSFLNRGVSASVKNAHYQGSPLEKSLAIAREIGAELIIDDNEVVLIPKGGTRSDEAPLLSADTGLIGYPTFDQNGIVCRCLFRKDLELAGRIKIETIVPKASGTWKVTKLSYFLSSHQPQGGPWECQLEGQSV